MDPATVLWNFEVETMLTRTRLCTKDPEFGIQNSNVFYHKSISSYFYYVLPLAVCHVPFESGLEKIDFGWEISGLRECVSTGAAGARTRRSLGHHLLHPQILRLLVLYAPADFEAKSSLL